MVIKPFWRRSAVAPCAGAGIEILLTVHQCHYPLVAPCAGAGIEIDIRGVYKWKGVRSPPARGRGLKLI